MCGSVIVLKYSTASGMMLVTKFREDLSCRNDCCHSFQSSWSSHILPLL